jgi:hypothetical protein
VGNALAKYRSMMAIPVDNGEPLNWAIRLDEDPRIHRRGTRDNILRTNIGATVKNVMITKQLRRQREDSRRDRRLRRFSNATAQPAAIRRDIATSYETFDTAGGGPVRLSATGWIPTVKPSPMIRWRF